VGGRSPFAGQLQPRGHHPVGAQTHRPYEVLPPTHLYFASLLLLCGRERARRRQQALRSKQQARNEYQSSSTRVKGKRSTYLPSFEHRPRNHYHAETTKDTTSDSSLILRFHPFSSTLQPPQRIFIGPRLYSEESSKEDGDCQPRSARDKVCLNLNTAPSLFWSLDVPDWFD
jgi:hypothetical protein